MSAKDNGDIFDLDATLFCGQCFSLGRRAVGQIYILRRSSLAHSAGNSTTHVSTA